jgi:hypothetical protein
MYTNTMILIAGKPEVIDKADTIFLPSGTKAFRFTGEKCS